jgi:hypothetical protein
VIARTFHIGDTDIKKVTEEMLLNAAILADRGHKAPHEYIAGVFSAFNIRDIDTQAWIALEKMREERKQRKGA